MLSFIDEINADRYPKMHNFYIGELPTLLGKIRDAIVSIEEDPKTREAAQKLLDEIAELQNHYMVIDSRVNENRRFLISYIADPSNPPEQIVYAEELLNGVIKNNCELSDKIIQGFQDLSEKYEVLFYLTC